MQHYDLTMSMKELFMNVPLFKPTPVYSRTPIRLANSRRTVWVSLYHDIRQIEIAQCETLGTNHSDWLRCVL